MRHNEASTLGRRIRNVLDVLRRQDTGRWAKPEDRAQARIDLLALQTVKALHEPIPDLKLPKAGAVGATL